MCEGKVLLWADQFNEAHRDGLPPKSAVDAFCSRVMEYMNLYFFKVTRSSTPEVVQIDFNTNAGRVKLTSRNYNSFQQAGTEWDFQLNGESKQNLYKFWLSNTNARKYDQVDFNPE